MNVKLIAAALVTLGLAACSPDITPQASTAPAAPVASTAPAEEQQIAKAEQATAAPAMQEEKKEEGAAAPATEVKAEEGEKKAD